VRVAGRFEDHVRPHGPLVPLVPDLWQVTGTAMPLDRNMVVWRRPGGGLWLHSVVALDAAGMSALDALGPVEFIVVPNAMHRLDCGVYAERYPAARVVAPEAARAAVAEKVRVDGGAEELAAEMGLTVHTPRGTVPGEVAYEIPVVGGRALVVADLLFNIVQRPPGLTGLVLRYVTNSVGPAHVSRVFRWLVLRDEAAYADWVASLADIPDVRVMTVGHGEPITGDVSAQLRDAAARIRTHG
jgi:hypothetical protein